MKTSLRKIAEKLLDRKLIKTFSHGYDAFQDMKKKLPESSFKVVFDVGANDGRSAVEFVKQFPSANIFCFEPVKSTFDELEANMGSVEMVKSFHLALGSSEGNALIDHDTNPRCNSIRVNASSGETGESVTVNTVDSFCKSHPVSQIDFLKIDTEGFDLEVLKGSEEFLIERRISFLQVEASMNQLNTKHIAFEEFKSFLEPRGYHLFGVYDQTLERSGQTRLRYSNPVFVCDNLV